MFIDDCRIITWLFMVSVGAMSVLLCILMFKSRNKINWLKYQNCVPVSQFGNHWDTEMGVNLISDYADPEL